MATENITLTTSQEDALKKMLINLSNHPQNRWSPQQTSIANELFGEIYDLPFPAIDPKGDETYIQELAETYLLQVMELSKNKMVTVHIMGEMNFTHLLVNRLLAAGIPCVASTTSRIVEEHPNGEKTAIFTFERFRHYQNPSPCPPSKK